MQKAFAAMDELEKGAIANPDEKRMVGHYWLRAPELAPTPEIAAEIADTLADDQDVRRRRARRQDQAAGTAASSRSVLSIGIGGSALGPDVRRRRPGRPGAATRCRSISSTTPIRTASPACWPTLDGQARRDARASSSPRAAARRRRATACCWSPRPIARRGPRLRPARRRHHHARLAAGPARAANEGWLTRFPMWDWVGGRTSELSRRRPGAGGAAGAGHRRPARRRRRLRRGHAAARHCEEPRRPAGPDVVSRHRRQGPEGHGRPALQGPAAALQPVPAAARDGVARQAARPATASASTRASPSTATRARPTSTPTCSSCATA